MVFHERIGDRDTPLEVLVRWDKSFRISAHFSHHCGMLSQPCNRIGGVPATATDRRLFHDHPFLMGFATGIEVRRRTDWHLSHQTTLWLWALAHIACKTGEATPMPPAPAEADSVCFSVYNFVASPTDTDAVHPSPALPADHPRVAAYNIAWLAEVEPA